MKRLKTPLILLLVLVGLAVLGLVARRLEARRMKAAEDIAPAEVAPWSLRTGVATRGDLRVTYGSLGTLASIAEVQVAGRFPGAILEMGPREGERVEVGTLLARVDTEEFDADLAAKQAELDAALEEHHRLDRELERETELLASGGSTQSKVDGARSAATAMAKRVEALQKTIEAENTRRGYARVTSPVAGLVKSRLAEVGDLCVAYHPLYAIDADGAARLTLRLPQSLADDLDVGTPISIINGPETLEASVTRIHPELSPLALLTVDADLERLPFRLPSGARVETRVVLDEARDAVIVPLDSLFGTPGARRVLRVMQREDGAFAEAVPVHVSLAGDSGVAVTPAEEGALSAGDVLALGRPERLAKITDGDPVLVWEQRP